MQERDFIPQIGMTKDAFWDEVRSQCKEHDADNILIYMRLMLQKAEAAQVQVRRQSFVEYGKKLKLFRGVEEWFERINRYGKAGGFRVSHHIISSGIREMIMGTPIRRYFKDIYASSYCFDHHDVARWPALALNYTTKTQFLFRINKGAHHVYEHDRINGYVAPEERPVPFTNMIFIGDGETDIPCFRLVKEQGGHSIAVFQPHTRRARSRSVKLLSDGRVNFIAPADYSEKKPIDLIVKAVMEKVAATEYLKRFVP